MYFFGGGGGVTISINISPSNVIKAKKGTAVMYDHPQDDCHHLTTFNLCCTSQQRTKRSCFPERLWPTWKQHQINQTFTRLQKPMKRKKNGFQIKRHPRCFLYADASSSTSVATFHHLHLHLWECFFSYTNVWWEIVKFGGLHEWTCQCWCIYSELRGCISVCFSLHNEERAISSVLLFSMWCHCWCRRS